MCNCYMVRNLNYSYHVSYFLHIHVEACKLMCQYCALLDSNLVRNSEDEAHLLHYENTSMQYTAIFHGCKNVHFQMKFFAIFLVFAQNIDCGYTLEPPH